MPLDSAVAKPALIIGIALMGLGGVIWQPQGLFNRHSDLIAYHLGTQTVLHQMLNVEHRLPLWRPDVLSGEPALTNPQALFTHPLHLLFALVTPERVVGLVIWLQMLIAALGAYYAAGALGISTAARLMVAVAMLFSFKTILAVYAGWLSVLAGIAALPLWFGALAITMERPSLRAGLAFGGAGALFLHSGNLQLFYYAALFSLFWTSGRVVRLSTVGDWQTIGRLLGSLALGAAIAVGLSAYLVIPLAHDAGLVTRSVASYDFFLGSHPTSVLDLMTFFHPELHGTPLDGSFVESWEYVAYVGAATSLFAIAGVSSIRQRPVVRVLVIGLLASVLLAVQTPLLRFVYDVVPGYALFRLPARILFLSAFFVCCLAGIGLERVLSTIGDSKWRRLVAVVAITLVALEGRGWAERYLRTSEPISPVTSAEYLKVVASPGPPNRVAPLSRSLPDYGSAAVNGLQLVTGYDSFVMRHYQTYLDLVQHNATAGTRPAVWTDIDAIRRFDLLAALNVLYLVSPKPLEIPADEYMLEGSFDRQKQFRFYEGIASGPAYVYRNLRFLPRAFFVSDVISAPDERAVVGAVEQVDVRKTAVITAPAAGGASAGSPDDKVAIFKSSAGELALTARNAERRFLVLSEVWHPGWSAHVDGRSTSLTRTDIALLGLWLEPGDHQVEIRFWPPGLTLGLVVTGLTIVGVLGLLIRLANKLPSPTPPSP